MSRPSEFPEPTSGSLVDDAVYRPVRSGNSLEDTVARLMQTIRLGVVAPGQALPAERELALRFSVSRDTVREAIRELADAGFLASRRGRYGGTFVSDHRAARSLDQAERAALWARLGEVAASGTADYRRLDSRLHLTIAEVAGVPSLVTLMADNRSRINELLDSFPLLPRNIEHSNRQHERIVVAILAGDAESAAEAMREHLDGSGALLRGFLG
jgi:GntR family transcriptional repressor for pyruvate dehydrogenase complex